MSDSYFQNKCREDLAKVRERVSEIQQNAIESNPEYLTHEQRYPGRVAHFMSLAANHLDEAERLIPAMTPGSQQKAPWVIFTKELQLADHCVRQALWDPSVQRDRVQQAATRKKRRPRWPELDGDIRAMLEANPKATNKAIWKQLPGSFDDKTYYVDDDKIFSESGRGRGLEFGGFSKRVSTIRKEFKKPR